MKFKRVIARLDIKGPNLVKGIHLEGLRVLGKPEMYAEYYFNQGVDELIYSDVVASLYERNSILKTIKDTAKTISIPMTVGGGIRSLEDIREILSAGADKVALNTVAIKKPNFINEAARVFGSSTIVVAIEATKEKNGNYLAYTDNGRQFTGVEVIKWAKEIEERGAGEILLTSIDKEGTGEGLDIELISSITNKVKIPVVAHGGAGNKLHVEQTFNETRCDGIAISSLLHYGSLEIMRKKDTQKKLLEGNKEFFLSNVKNFKSFKNENVRSLKNYLLKKKISVRPPL
jgi:cyclase